MQRIQDSTDATGQPWSWTERKGVKDGGRREKQETEEMCFRENIITIQPDSCIQ